MTSETQAKKDIQRLQRAIVDGLEDVKAQEIVVFNTEHLSPLFERVIIASGTSNRQTKALAASVRDAVREAGFDKPRIEGEDNGEWIIVDCGAAVAHVMQPVIRQYYRLEEIWGQKPVRVKHGAEKPVVAAKAPARKKAKVEDKPVKAIAAKTVARTAAKSAAKSAAASAPKPSAKPKAASGKTVAGKTAARKTVAGDKPKAKMATVVVKPRSTTKPGATKPTEKPARKPAAKRPAVKKA
ncbi:ribosome silencing factor [Hydrogenophaga sp.]|uniref:ribosome silencing factor n=1 Tax=Hydrogenophaga sp. TaxID=1904254 RepID=UPI00356288D6